MLDYAERNALEKEFSMLIGTSSPITCQDVLGRLKQIKTDQNSDSKIQFTLPSPKLIDFNEIKNSLSRKQPLLFLELNDEINVYLHSSIKEKAKILGLPENLLPTTFDIIELKKDWIKYVKKIKCAQWGENKDKTTVKMIFPKI